MPPKRKQKQKPPPAGGKKQKTHSYESKSAALARNLAARDAMKAAANQPLQPPPPSTAVVPRKARGAKGRSGTNYTQEEKQILLDTVKNIGTANQWNWDVIFAAWKLEIEKRGIAWREGMHAGRLEDLYKRCWNPKDKTGQVKPHPLFEAFLAVEDARQRGTGSLVMDDDKFKAKRSFEALEAESIHKRSQELIAPLLGLPAPAAALMQPSDALDMLVASMGTTLQLECDPALQLEEVSGDPSPNGLQSNLLLEVAADDDGLLNKFALVPFDDEQNMGRFQSPPPPPQLQAPGIRAPGRQAPALALGLQLPALALGLQSPAFQSPALPATAALQAPPSEGQVVMYQQPQPKLPVLSLLQRIAQAEEWLGIEPKPNSGVPNRMLILEQALCLLGNQGKGLFARILAIEAAFIPVPPLTGVAS